MERIEYLELSAVQILKKEFKEARQVFESYDLKKEHFESRVAKENPEWDTMKGGAKIHNAWNGIAADVFLTRLITEYVSELESQFKTFQKK